MASDVQDVEFYNVFDGRDGRPESVYLDMVERQQAERTRAIAEGREPEDVNSQNGKLAAGVGTPLVVEARRVDNKYYSNPSQIVLESKDVDPVATLPVDTGTADEDIDLAFAAQVAKERDSQDKALSGKGSADVTSTGAQPSFTQPKTAAKTSTGSSTKVQ